MEGTLKSGTAFFTVTGEFLTNFARQRYWYEDAREAAKGVLLCLEPKPTQVQMMAVINGEAQLDGDSTKGIQLVYMADTKFQIELSEWLDWKDKSYKEQLAEMKGWDSERDSGVESDSSQGESQRQNVLPAPGSYIPVRGVVGTAAQLAAPAQDWGTETTPIGGKPIPTKLLFEYAQLIVTKIRPILMMGLAARLPVEALMRVEDRRQELHNTIIVFAGLKRDGPGYDEFASDLADYVDQLATPPGDGA